jgi:DNA-binding response OmpR family regulator
MTEIIYILEIDTDVSALMQSILEELGYEVVTESIGSSLSDFERPRADLIFLDYRIVKKHPEVCRRLKDDLLTELCPIIVTTTEYQPEKLLRLLMADDVLSKPFGLDELVAKVLYWLSKPRV